MNTFFSLQEKEKKIEKPILRRCSKGIFQNSSDESESNLQMDKFLLQGWL